MQYVLKREDLYFQKKMAHDTVATVSLILKDTVAKIGHHDKLTRSVCWKILQIIFVYKIVKDSLL